jgi:hypothetical protein
VKDEQIALNKHVRERKNDCRRRRKHKRQESSPSRVRHDDVFLLFASQNYHYFLLKIKLHQNHRQVQPTGPVLALWLLEPPLYAQISSVKAPGSTPHPSKVVRDIVSQNAHYYWTIN